MLLHVMSGMQKLKIDLRIVSSCRSFQIVCSAKSRSSVSVSAPETSPTWLLTYGSQGVQGCLAGRSPCQLRNSFLRLVFPSIWRTSSKYSTKQRIYAKLCAKQMSNVWCKNNHAFLRYGDFRVGAFYLPHPVYLYFTNRVAQFIVFLLFILHLYCVNK